MKRKLSELEQEWGEWYTLGGVSRLLETLGLTYTRNLLYPVP
ncbi:hypothetical protein RCO48_32860 [Peribacillus frigoritolerans]|nr:hypothetical protein [Peribacillus frigoritolerans]